MLKSILFFALLAFTTVTRAQSTLEIQINNLRNSDGLLFLEVVDENNKSIRGNKNKIVDQECVITFENMPNGRYAVRYFHDENSNNKMDKNFIGIPKEGFGFSNNAYGKFGPKDFEEWLITISGYTKIKLKPYYF